MTTWQENDLHAAQLELEKESTSLGIARYEKIREQRQEAETGPGRKLVMESIDATAAAIMAFVAEADTGKPGKRHAALKFIRHLNPHALAYLTSFTCVNALVADHRKAVSVAITLGHEVANEINFSLLREKHPGLYRVVQEQLKKSTSARHSTAVMRHVIADAEFAPEDDKRLYLSDKDALLVGMKLIELFVEATGLVELVTVAERGKRHLLIAGNQKVLDWLTKAHDSAALYQPVLMPMVVPPRPWTTPRDGGYLTDIGGRADLVRTRNRAYMAPINTMLQRIAGRATLLRLLDMANAKKLSDAEVARLRTWGLDEKAQADVFGYLKGKRQIEQIDPDKLPFQTRERMAAFLFRVTRHQVLEGDASDSIELMHSTTGRIVTQFRSFMVNSYTRHFLNSVHHYDDWRTYAMVVLSTSAAGMGWAARTYINTAGNPEQRKKQLTQENFYKNAVAQSSWSNVISDVETAVVQHGENIAGLAQTTEALTTAEGVGSVWLDVTRAGMDGIYSSGSTAIPMGRYGQISGAGYQTGSESEFRLLIVQDLDSLRKNGIVRSVRGYVFGIR